jgi:pimeloyl-ACP methyl ester carboxylesterase
MLLIALITLLQSGARASSGTVFLDRNGNGVRDRSEPGIARVVVSNQEQAVETDSNGGFALSSGGYGLVFVSLPDGYRAVGRFWQAAGDAPLAFALAPAPAPRAFSFIHASDTHLDSASLPRTQWLEHLTDSLRPDFVIITGDLIRDALRVSDTVARTRYELFARERSRFTRPVWTIPGNHEIFGIERDKSHAATDHPLYARRMYRHYFGPDYYSFNYGGVHFVGLNSEDYDDQWYYGHIDSLQLAWLERDLSLVPAGTPVVTFNHIPFFTAAETINGYMDEPPAPSLITVAGKTTFRHVVSNAGEVLALLRRHRYPLALGGHVHIRETLEYQLDRQAIRFEQAAAVVGPSEGAGLEFRSGVTRYRVSNRAIDQGEFIPFPEPARDVSPHQTSFVTVGPRVRLEVLDWGGSGPPMLFLSGLGDTAHEFDDFAPRWTRKYHVLALTRRGFGASSQPPGGYQIDSLSHDIRVVLDSLKIEQAILVGHSLGGDELTRFAATWPERVSQLVYLDAAHDRVPLVAMLRTTPAPRPVPMTRADSASPEAVRQFNLRNSGVLLTMGEVLSIAVFGPDGRYLRDVTPPSVDSMILSGLEHPLYSRIEAPALALYAVPRSPSDMFQNYAAMDSTNRRLARRFYQRFGPWTREERERFRREVANGRVVELPGAHHYLFISNEVEVIREMSAFLAGD